jgi:hypothetical protein
MSSSFVSSPSVQAVAEPREFNSMPKSMGFAMKVARKWQEIPDSVTDDQALAQGFITPEQLQLILVIVQDMMQNCFSNQSMTAWKRIRTYLDTSKEMDRMADSIRMVWLVDRWFGRLGIARDRGDVKLLQVALVQTSGAVTEADFRGVQTEMLFLTI